MGLTPHSKTKKRWLVGAILNFGVFVRAFPTQVLTISSWRSTHKLCRNFYQSIAVPTNMPKRFQNSCGRQHRQQPLLHHNKWLFSRHRCVLSSAGGKWGWNADAVRICRYEHKEVWRICLLIAHTFFQFPARHQNSLCFCCKDTANQSSRGDGKLWQGKRRPTGLQLYTLLETQPITSREYISWAKQVSNIGLIPVLLEISHATALLNRVVNLVKEAVEHLDPNQTPVLTMGHPFSAIAKEIQWQWPDSFSNNKYVIMIEMARRVVQWFLVPSTITTAGTVLQNILWKHLISRGRDTPTRLQLKRCIFCSRVPSFLMCSLTGQWHTQAGDWTTAI